jgi:hypothetical protein
MAFGSHGDSSTGDCMNIVFGQFRADKSVIQ